MLTKKQINMESALI